MKRIILMLTVAAMMVVALSVAAPSAFATNTCKDTDTFTPTGPPFGQQSGGCVKGSTEEEISGHGKSTRGNNIQTTCVKHTGHGDVPVECPN